MFNQLRINEHASNGDLVSYSGSRSMVTVDMSVNSRLTDGRYLGLHSVDK